MSKVIAIRRTTPEIIDLPKPEVLKEGFAIVKSREVDKLTLFVKFAIWILPFKQVLDEDGFIWNYKELNHKVYLLTKTSYRQISEAEYKKSFGIG